MKKWIIVSIAVLVALIVLSVLMFHLKQNETTYNSPIATLQVTPQFLELNQTNKLFNVSVDVKDVVDLYGFEFKLSYDTGVLDALNITEGPFLKSGGPTFKAKMEINETTGTIYVAITLYETKIGITGSGTLVTITFNATSLGESRLNLYDTILGNSKGDPIKHEVIDGKVEVIPETYNVVVLLAFLIVSYLSVLSYTKSFRLLKG